MRLHDILCIDAWASVMLDDTATMSAALVDSVGPIRELVNQSHVLLYSGGKQDGSDGNHTGNPTDFPGIIKSSEGVSGTGGLTGGASVRLGMHMQNASGGGYRLENERMGEADSDKYVLASDPIRSYYKRMSLTGQLMKAAANGERAFKPALQEKMDRTVTSAANDVNFAAYGTGTGILTTLRNNEAAAQTVIDVTSTVPFEVGMIIDGVTISTAVVIEPARTVTSIDRPNKTITVTPALTTGLTATTDGWVAASSNSTVAAPNNSQNRQINGLGSICASSGNLSGLSPTLYPRWAAYNGTSIGAINDDALRLAKDSVGFETGLEENGNDFALITTYVIRSAYADTQLPLKRHVNTQKMQGGFDGLMFDENPIYVDRACQSGTLYGIRRNRLLWATLSDWDWMDADGSKLARVPGYDKYEAVLYTYHQFMTTERGSHFRLSGIDQTVFV